MRANREAFERRRLRPRMLTGNVQRDLSVEVLGTRVGGAVPARADRRPRHRPSRRRARRRARRGGERRPDRALERRVALDGAGGRGDRRRAALVPALLGLGPEDRRELRPARGGGGLRGDRRHARHARPRLASARPREHVPPVHPGRGLRAVLHRPGLPELPRGAAGGRRALGGGADALHLSRTWG